MVCPIHALRRFRLRSPAIRRVARDQRWAGAGRRGRQQLTLDVKRRRARERTAPLGGRRLTAAGCHVESAWLCSCPSCAASAKDKGGRGPALLVPSEVERSLPNAIGAMPNSKCPSSGANAVQEPGEYTPSPRSPSPRSLSPRAVSSCALGCAVLEYSANRHPETPFLPCCLHSRYSK
jgi:hypothetical protein